MVWGVSLKASSKKHRSTNGNLRYSAKLLFQFRVVIHGDSGKRRLCEERIITFLAAHARAALAEAKRRGKSACHRYRNSDGCLVHFEFIGVMELLCLDPACEPEEVWYQITERVRPMEQRKRLIPDERRLNAIRFNT
jgi:hypothetical protein